MTIILNRLHVVFALIVLALPFTQVQANAGALISDINSYCAAISTMESEVSNSDTTYAQMSATLAGLSAVLGRIDAGMKSVDANSLSGAALTKLESALARLEECGERDSKVSPKWYPKFQKLASQQGGNDNIQTQLDKKGHDDMVRQRVKKKLAELQGK